MKYRDSTMHQIRSFLGELESLHLERINKLSVVEKYLMKIEEFLNAGGNVLKIDFELTSTLHIAKLALEDRREAIKMKHAQTITM